MKGKRLQNLPQEETDRPLEVMDIAPHRQRLTEEVAATTSSGQAEEVKALTAALQGEMRRHRRDRKLYVAGTLSFLCLSLALLIAIGNIGAPHPLSTAANACFLAFVTLRIIYMVPVLYTQWKPRRCRRNLTAQLAARNDVRTVGPLVEVLSLNDEEIRQSAREALIRLLPQLKEADSACLNRA